MKTKITFFREVLHGMDGLKREKCSIVIEGNKETILEEAFDTAVSMGMNPFETFHSEEVR